MIAREVFCSLLFHGYYVKLTKSVYGWHTVFFIQFRTPLLIKARNYIIPLKSEKRYRSVCLKKHTTDKPFTILQFVKKIK